MITILKKFPIILTKNTDFMRDLAKNIKEIKPGEIILLPEDAILIDSEYTYNEKSLTFKKLKDK